MIQLGETAHSRPPHSPLLSPIRDRRHWPQVPLADKVAPRLDPRQEENGLLNIRCQRQKV